MDRRELEQQVRDNGWFLMEVEGYLGKGHPEDVSPQFIARVFEFPQDLAQEVYNYWKQGRDL
jgi:hypothetical protein